MGILRLIFIFFGLAICSEFTADATVLFRSYLAFFIMLALDYSRMMFNGISKYEKTVGYIGFTFCLLEGLLSLLAMGKSFVINHEQDAYFIMSTETFRMFPGFKWNVDSFFLWTSILTMSIAASELLIPFWNRYKKKKTEENKEASVMKKHWYQVWKRNDKKINPSLNFENSVTDNN